jgi:hypothetical protein
VFQLSREGMRDPKNTEDKITQNYNFAEALETHAKKKKKKQSTHAHTHTHKTQNTHTNINNFAEAPKRQIRIDHKFCTL